MTQPGGILALDLSLTTGWAYAPADQSEPPVGGAWKLPRSKDKAGNGQLGRVFSSLLNCIEDALEKYEPSLVVYEAPILRADKADRLLKCLCAMVELACFENDETPCREVTSGDARSLVLGRRSFRVPFRGKGVEKVFRENVPVPAGSPRGTKPAILRVKRHVGDAKEEVGIWARSQGYQPVDDNHADALLLLKFACVMSRSRIMAGAGSVQHAKN